MRLILTIALVLAIIATILAVTGTMFLGLGFLAWFVFSWLAYIVDVWIGDRVVLNTAAAPRVVRQ